MLQRCNSVSFSFKPLCTNWWLPKTMIYIFSEISEACSAPSSEVATRGVLQDKVFLEISENSQENTCAKVKAMPATLSKKRLWHRYFSINFAKFLRTRFLQNTSGRLLLPVNRIHKLSIFEKSSILDVYHCFQKKCNFMNFSCFIH